MGYANDVYDDVRDVIAQEDPHMEDFIWAEAIERRSAETVNLEEQAKAWDKEVKRFKEINMRYDQEIERFGDEIQSSLITDDEPDNITHHRLKRLVEGYPKLATLLFQDDANVQPAIQNIKQSGNELVSKLRNLQEEVQQIWVDFKDARKDYHGRLDDIIKPLQKELAETQDQLDSAQTLQSTTDAELTKVNEKLQEVTEQYQTSEKTLQDEIEECKAEISQLKREAVTASRQNLSYQAEIDKCKAEISQLKKQAVLASSQNISYQTEIGKLKSEGATTIRYLSTELESVTAENVRAKAQNSQHKAEIQAMTEAQNSLSTRNDEQEAEIKILEDTVKEVEETHSQENNQLQAQIQTLNADKDALSSQNSQYETQIHDLEAAKDALTIQKSEYQAKVRALVAEKDDLTTCNEEYQDRIRTLEAEKVDLICLNEEYQDQIRTLEVEKADLTSRNEENQSQIQTLIQTHQHESERLETANSKLDDQINDLQEAVRTMQLDNNNFASQIEDLTAKNQELVTEAEDQSRWEQQHLDRIAQLTVEIENCDETLRNAISEADEERRLNLEDKHQFQRVLFSNVLSLQGDKDGSLLAAGTRLFFKQQERLETEILASWIKEPVGDTLDQLTKSELTASLMKTYQLALQGLSCLHANGDFPDSLLSHLMSC